MQALKGLETRIESQTVGNTQGLLVTDLSPSS